MVRKKLLSITGALFFALSTHAGSWPEFRGPDGNGHVSGVVLPTKFEPGMEAWKQSIPGKGWSSPVVHEGKIYLTTAIPQGDEKQPDQSLEALCLNANDGKKVWQTKVVLQKAETAPKIHNKNSHASPTPIYKDGKVYVHFGHMGTACLNASDGKINWQIPGLYTKPTHGNGGSPILYKDLLIFSCDGMDAQKVVGLSISDGKVRWSVERNAGPAKPFSFCTPALIEDNNRKMVISPGSDMVGAYDPETGKELWRVKYKGYSVIPKPVYSNGLVFISTSYDKPVLYAIKPNGNGDVTETHVAWKLDKNVPHTASMLLHKGNLFMVADNGMASCVEQATGKVLWQERLQGAYSASPVLSGENLFFQSEDGKTTVLKAKSTFEQVSTSDMKDRTLASYAIADGKLFVRTEKQLFAFPVK